MANYGASVLQKAQVMLNDRFSSAEMRTKPSSILMMLLKNRDFLIPDLAQLRDREDRATSTYIKNRAQRTLLNARSHNHSGAVADSTEVAINYTTYADVAQTSLKRADNNLFNDAEILSHEIENMLINLHEGIESDLVQWLDTVKTQASNPPAGSLKRATFNATTNVYEVAAGNADEYLSIAKSIFRQEKFGGGLFDAIIDSGLYTVQEKQANQGAGNSTNLSFQFSGVEARESIEISDGTYTNGLGYFVPQGMAGIIDWIPPVNKAGKGDFQSVLGGFSTIVDPMTGLTFGLHGYTERGDTSAANGNVQDEVTEWELSLDLSPQHAPIVTNTSGQSPIFAIAQL